MSPALLGSQQPAAAARHLSVPACPSRRHAAPSRRSRHRCASVSDVTASPADAEAELAGTEGSPYARELAVGLEAVRLACSMCQKIQAGIMVQEEEGLNTKTDRSLVTTADYASQALISKLLSDAFGSDVSLVAEEDSASLRGSEGGAAMLQRVTAAVNGALRESGRAAMSSEEVLTAIDRGGAVGGREGRHWVLDPVDGTLGFVRGDQYAVALALLDGGALAVGVLGCPNMPTRPDLMEANGVLCYGFSPRLVSKMLAGASGAGAWYKGVVFAAARGSGGTLALPCDAKLGATGGRVVVSPNQDASSARLTEPVLKANSSHGFTAQVVTHAGLSSRPLRLYSMVKYGAVARGDADVFMKFPKAGYKEKVWDHAAGVIVVEEAGGVVTDAAGAALDFGAGRFLKHVDRGIIAASRSMHSTILGAVQASWDSSSL